MNEGNDEASVFALLLNIYLTGGLMRGSLRACF
jgi:hypothetical protein